MRKRRLINVAVLLLSTAASVQPAKHKSLKINGQMLDEKGHPVAGAKVQAVSDRPTRLNFLDA